MILAVGIILIICWPSYSHLFCINAEFEEELIKGNISEKLRDEFKKNNYPISVNATLEVKEDKWIIADKTESITVTKSGRELKIFRRLKPLFLPIKCPTEEWSSIFTTYQLRISCLFGLIVVIFTVPTYVEYTRFEQEKQNENSKINFTKMMYPQNKP